MKTLTSILAAALAVLCLAASASAETGISPAHEFAPHQVVVKFRGAGLSHSIALPRGVSVRDGLAALNANPRVVYAQPDYIATVSTSIEFPNDPGTLRGTGEPKGKPHGWATRQWDLLPWTNPRTPAMPTSPGGIDAPAAWRRLAEVHRPGGAGIKVAVLDTGVAYGGGEGFLRSPDFSKFQFAPGYDFIDGDRRPHDENGHGTHVTAEIAARSNNGVGMAGIAPGVRLMAVRVLNRGGHGRASQIARGIEFAVSHKADVINMSFNFECGEQVRPVEEALRNAFRKGVITVASVGNIGSEGCVAPPATGPHVIGVGGSTEGGCLGAYSLAGTEVDLVAPGGGPPIAECPSILSRPIFQITLKPGTKNEFFIPIDYIGTSMAAAHVSGAAALVLASGVVGHALRKDPIRVRRVTRRLRRTARDIGLPATQQGAGLLDLGAAVGAR